MIEKHLYVVSELTVLVSFSMSIEMNFKSIFHLIAIN